MDPLSSLIAGRAMFNRFRVDFCEHGHRSRVYSAHDCAIVSCLNGSNVLTSQSILYERFRCVVHFVGRSWTLQHAHMFGCNFTVGRTTAPDDYDAQVPIMVLDGFFFFPPKIYISIVLNHVNRMFVSRSSGRRHVTCFSSV